MDLRSRRTRSAVAVLVARAMRTEESAFLRDCRRRTSR